MIVVDLQQIFVSSLLASFGNEPDQIEENLVRHMIFNSLRYYRSKFVDAGQMVLACDNRNSWRKDEFQYYKAKRKESRAKSKLDWDSIFAYFHQVKHELREYSPYYLIEVEGAEGDDVIAVLCDIVKDEEIIIISDDKDFKQLQHHSHVKQFSPNKKEFIVTENPHHYLRDHIIRGDSSDGIPNIKSQDNIFMVEGKRQSPVYKKEVDEWLEGDPKDLFDEERLERFRRNERLVDLSRIPATIRDRIEEEYQDWINNGPNGDRRTLRKLFQKYRMRELLDLIQQF